MNEDVDVVIAGYLDSGSQYLKARIVYSPDGIAQHYVPRISG